MQKIMFSDKYGLTRAVLEGRKTQTRRIATHVSIDNLNVGFISEGYDTGRLALCDGDNILAMSRYKYGEVVAVAQSYERIIVRGESPVLHNMFLGDDAELDKKGWNNKMFVRLELMPHRVKITNIGVERLQDISDEDCMKEGVIHYDDVFGEGYMLAETYNNNYRRHCFTTPRKAFAALIDKTCGKGTWESNPYVFVYDLELVKS